MIPVNIDTQAFRMFQQVMEAKVIALRGTPMLRGMRNAVLIVERAAKQYAPVDTGRLRASIVPEVRVSEGDVVEGIVGSNVHYAPYQEFGTKYIQPRRYLGQAFEYNQDAIYAQIGEVVSEIMREDSNEFD